jgi:hypothetical protein
MAGALLLAADAALIFAFRRRVPVDRMSLYTLPLLVAGLVLLILGVV